ncbi:MAG: hypothetical protein JSU86_06405 [Phycisphaerales bacterium]|nr:MAG: hypothetical protein JSU86_06405 [Phycisphaerales bacterium]
MPELFGISAADVAPAQRRGMLAMMQQEFLGFRPGRVETQDCGLATVGTVAWHPNDPATIVQGATQRRLCAWIGRAPKSQGPLDVDRVADSLLREDYRPLQELDAPFTASVIDAYDNRLWLFTDPYSIYPVYYTFQNGVLACATKMAPLLRGNCLSWTLDPQAVLDFFTYEHVTGDRTFALEVKILAPGTILSIEDGKASLHRYVKREMPEATPSPTLQETVDLLFEGLSDSVARSVSECKRVAVPLSGGMDSRALLGLALRHGANVRAYTFGIPGCADIEYAHKVACVCGVPHRVIEIDGSYLQEWLDYAVFVTGGMVSSVHHQILSLGRMLADEADVVLDGMSGDALTGGILTWKTLCTNDVGRAAKIFFRHRATAWADSADRARLFNAEFLGQVQYDPIEPIRRYFGRQPRERCWKSAYSFDLHERQRRFVRYGPHLLYPLVAVETPFFGGGIPELTSVMPLSQLMQQRAYVAMLSKHLPTLAAVPDAARRVPVSWPTSVRFAKRVFDVSRRGLIRSLSAQPHAAEPGITDYAGWFRTDLREFVQDRLLTESGFPEEVLCRRAVEELAREHLEGLADHTAKLGCLLAFTTWYRSMRRRSHMEPHGSQNSEIRCQ